MIDLHCHLDLYPDPARVADECRKRGLHVLSVTTTPSAWRGTRAIAQGEDRVMTALGLHPQLAHERRAELGLFDQLLPDARYVGEIGLDGTPQLRRHWEDQVAVFRHILGSCQDSGGRIMSIHTRRASRPVLDCLEAHPGAGVPILHWFSGSFRDLDCAIAQGCWFTVGPAMLHGERGRTLSARMPRDRVLTESDGPLARVEGRMLWPWDVATAIADLGRLWGVGTERAREIVRGNLEDMLNSI